MELESGWSHWHVSLHEASRFSILDLIIITCNGKPVETNRLKKLWEIRSNFYLCISFSMNSGINKEWCVYGDHENINQNDGYQLCQSLLESHQSWWSLELNWVTEEYLTHHATRSGNQIFHPYMFSIEH